MAGSVMVTGPHKGQPKPWLAKCMSCGVSRTFRYWHTASTWGWKHKCRAG